MNCGIRTIFPIITAAIVFIGAVNPWRSNAMAAGQNAAQTDIDSPILITKHEDEVFKNQTVYISGQAFIRCKFEACTLVIRETLYHLEGCTFERCNWKIDWLHLWGNKDSLTEIKSLINLMRDAQTEQLKGKPPENAENVKKTPLTKHEGETFKNETVYLGGQAFIKCKFEACTLVVRESEYHLEGCAYDRSNWHIDWLLLWGSQSSLRELSDVTTLIETTTKKN